MKKIWRKFELDGNRYKISNYGEVYSFYSKRLIGFISRNRRYIGTEINNYAIDKLVLKYFKKEELNKDYALHLDANRINDKVDNLEWSTRGDLLRYYYQMKGQKRGVYKFNVKMPNNNIWKRYRAVLKVNNRTMTLGYFKTKKEAITAYITGYYNIYKQYPY